MGAIYSEIVHLLKVKLSLQNDQRLLLLLSWFSKFSGGGPPYPPSRLQNMRFIEKKKRGLFCQLNTAFTQSFFRRSDFLLICD